MTRASIAIAVALAAASSGCMNIMLSGAMKNPGPHDSPLAIVASGAVADGLTACGAAGIHAAASDQVTFREALPYYLVPLLAADLVVAVIRIKRYMD